MNSHHMLYLAVTTHLVALAEALLLGGAQRVPEHDVIAQGHMHAPAALGLACEDTGERDQSFLTHDT